MKTAISFIVIFNIMVFVHEFGHYYMARRHGIRVHEFALGMGPAIWKKEKGGTVYALRAFPIGGFVKMEGEDTDSFSADSFNVKTPWQRFQVIVAGAVNNILLAFIAFFVAYLLSGGVVLNDVESVMADSPAAQAGIQAGDKILTINDERVLTRIETSMLLMEADKVALQVERDGQKLLFEVTPEYNEAEQRKLIGISYAHSNSVLRIAQHSLYEMAFYVEMTFDFFGKLFQGKASGDEVSGPVGIVRVIGDVAQIGILPLVKLLGMLSLSLGIFNLLPIPALDGGRLIFILIEMVRRKPLPPEKEGLVHAIGFVFLILLIVFVTYRDIVKLF